MGSHSEWWRTDMTSFWGQFGDNEIPTDLPEGNLTDGLRGTYRVVNVHFNRKNMNITFLHPTPTALV